MRHRAGQNRQQFGLFATPLDDMIAPDNMVRVVDAFVDAIDLEKHGRNGQVQNRFRRYRLPFAKCKSCICAPFCLNESAYRIRHGRHIERSLDEAATEANRLRVLNNRPIYKRRQAIVEHPYGTIKRGWGFYYTLLKGKEKVSGEYSLVFLAYNMRRAITILGVSGLIERLKRLLPRFFAPWPLVADVGAVGVDEFWDVVSRSVAGHRAVRLCRA